MKDFKKIKSTILQADKIVTSNNSLQQKETLTVLNVLRSKGILLHGQTKKTQNYLLFERHITIHNLFLSGCFLYRAKNLLSFCFYSHLIPNNSFVRYIKIHLVFHQLKFHLISYSH